MVVALRQPPEMPHPSAVKQDRLCLIPYVKPLNENCVYKCGMCIASSRERMLKARPFVRRVPVDQYLDQVQLLWSISTLMDRLTYA